MPFSVDRVGRLFIIRWTDLDLTDLPRAMIAIEAAYGEVGKLLYVTVVTPYARVPNGEERRKLNEFGERVHARCERVYLVFQGDSLRHKLQRTAMTGIMMLLRNKTPTTIHKSVMEFLPDLAERMGKTVDEVRRIFIERSLS